MKNLATLFFFGVTFLLSSVSVLSQQPPTPSTGCVSGNCISGYGKLITASGDIYEGNFVNKAANGKGKLTSADGSVYEGDFANGKRDGLGIFTSKSGEIYVGPYANNTRNGKGKSTFASGNIYEGEFVNGKREGQGSYKYKNGDLYTGQFANDKKNGKGKMTFGTDNIYDGDWVDDRKEGQGTFTFKNGDIFTGQFANNLRNGSGRSKFINGDTYDGAWVNDKFEGQGVYTFKNGNYYTGQFKANKQDGIGKEYIKSTNTTREGIWTDGILGQSLWVKKRDQGAEQFADEDYDEAVKSYTECIRDNEQADECYNGRGKAYWTLGKVVEGSADLEKAVKLNPNNKVAVADLKLMKENKDTLFNNDIFVDDDFSFVDDLLAERAKAGKQITDPNAAKKDVPKQIRTESEWQKLSAPYITKMDAAIYSNKDEAAAMRVYEDFDAATKEAGASTSVRNTRKALLKTMHRSNRYPLMKFVREKLKTLNYNEEETKDILSAQPFYV